jgi:hypothetical protein
MGLGLRLSQSFWAPQPSPSHAPSLSVTPPPTPTAEAAAAAAAEAASHAEMAAVAAVVARYLEHACAALGRFSDELLCAALKMVRTN